MTMDSTTTLIGNSFARRLVRLSEALRRFVDFVGRWGALFIVPLIAVTMLDVTIRKLVWIQLWLIANVSRIFESTLLQELEWHFHTALFALVLGYGSIHNSHVRVDLVRERLSERVQWWIELLGCLLFLIPYCLLVVYFSYDFTLRSFLGNETSASATGLTHRWIIKSTIPIGFSLLGLAGIAVALRKIAELFGPPELRQKVHDIEEAEAEHLIDIKLDERNRGGLP